MPHFTQSRQFVSPSQNIHLVFTQPAWRRPRTEAQTLGMSYPAAGETPDPGVDHGYVQKLKSVPAGGGHGIRYVAKRASSGVVLDIGWIFFRNMYGVLRTVSTIWYRSDNTALCYLLTDGPSFKGRVDPGPKSRLGTNGALGLSPVQGKGKKVKVNETLSGQAAARSGRARRSANKRTSRLAILS